MGCNAIREDGTIDFDLCSHLTTHPLKNRYFCKPAECLSGSRLCWSCVGQRWRRFGHISHLIPSVFVVGAMAEDLSVCDHETGLCVFHTDNGPNADRFPLDKWSVVMPKAGNKNKKFHMATKPAKVRKLGKRERTYIREEIPLDLLEQLELPEVDSSFDPDDDLGAEPFYETPTYPKPSAEKPKQEVKHRPAPATTVPIRHLPTPTVKKPLLVSVLPVVTEPPAPRVSPQRNPTMVELDNLIAFLTKTPSTVGVLVQDDEE